MLEQLYIKDFALIEEIRISFGPDLNLITGGTWAGKSIILGALGLLMGNKATTDLIRSGSKRAIVEACFAVKDDENAPVIFETLDSHGVESEGSTIII